MKGIIILFENFFNGKIILNQINKRNIINTNPIVSFGN